MRRFQGSSVIPGVVAALVAIFLLLPPLPTRAQTQPQGTSATQDELNQTQQFLQNFQKLRQRIRQGDVLLVQPEGKDWPMPVDRAVLQKWLQVQVHLGELTPAQASAQLDQAKRFTANFEATKSDRVIAAAQAKINQLKAQAGGAGGGTGGGLFDNPQINGRRVDHCLKWQGQCGRPAADYFCRQKGYALAGYFETVRFRPTLVLGDNKVCDSAFCVGFTRIECHMGGSTGGTTAGTTGGVTRGTGGNSPLPQTASTPMRVTLSAKHSGKCMTVSGTGLAQGFCRGLESQQFTLRGSGSGVFQIVAQAAGQCIDQLDSKNNGAPFALNPCGGQESQQFSFQDVGDGYYQILCKHSGKVVDVWGASGDDSVPIWQWDWLNGDNQKWRLSNAATSAPVTPQAAAVGGSTGGPGGTTAGTTGGVTRGTAGTSMETGTDLPGSDYRSFDLPAAQPTLCRDACQGDPNCKAYTYVKPGVQGSQARCYLKSSVPSRTANNCCVSGVKGTAGGTGTAQEFGTDGQTLQGNSFNAFGGTGIGSAQCKAACDKDGSCAGWVLVKPAYSNPGCYLMSSVTNRIANPCCRSEQKAGSVAGQPGGTSRGTPNIYGLWYDRGGAWVYQFTQNGNRFHWERNPRESADGTIDGSALFANWGTGQGNGRVTQVDANNVATRIQWDNGEVFVRGVIAPPQTGCDITGTWNHTTQGFGPTPLSFKNRRGNTWDAEEGGLGFAKGPATLTGFHLHIDWKTADATGTFDWNLNPSCTAGDGSEQDRGTSRASHLERVITNR